VGIRKPAALVALPGADDKPSERIEN
jgi:hypothetical protein